MDRNYFLLKKIASIRQQTELNNQFNERAKAVLLSLENSTNILNINSKKKYNKENIPTKTTIRRTNHLAYWQKNIWSFNDNPVFEYGMAMYSFLLVKTGIFLKLLNLNSFNYYLH